jgi:hypothetical protein
VRKLEGKLLTAWSTGDTVDKSITRSKILGRVEVDTERSGWVELYVEEQLLKAHCVSMSFGYADFKSEMERIFKVTYIKKNMTSGTNGPLLRVNTMHISRSADECEDLLPVGKDQAG